MQVAPIPENEAERLDHLRRLEILDTLAEREFDDLVRIASQICGTPIALISLVDDERQWFKARVGLDAAETSRDVAFCSHAIFETDVFVVEDSLTDERFRDNPLVTGAPEVRFYAGAPLVTQDGLGLGTLCVIDHRPRKLTADQLECLRGLGRQILRQFELRLLMNEMRRMDELRSDFIATVNHELRTPLTSIRGALSLVNSGRVDSVPTGEAGSLLRIAERNSLQLLSLVNDLLDMQKIEAGELELELEPVDLIELISAAVELHSPFVVAQDCRLEWRPQGAGTSAVMVQADGSRIVQVIGNLVSNAAKFSPADSGVRIQLGTVGDAARVSVIDSGCGIPLSARSRVFDKFAQIRCDGDGEAVAKGTGLGLAICKTLVEQHGGAIGFDSEVGAGSTFYFDLPLAAAAATP